MATGLTTLYSLPYPQQTDPVNVAGDIEQLANKIDNILQEVIEDVSASMLTGGTFTNGLNTPTYNDGTGKISMSLSQDLRSTASPSFVDLTLSGDAAINGGDITSTASTFNLINTNATTLNLGGAATAINIGNASGQTNFSGDINIATGKVFEINNNTVLTENALGTGVVLSSLTSVGTITSGTWSASFGSVSGANLTNLSASSLTGTIPSTVLGNSNVFIGTTSIALNRASSAQSLTGITSIDGSAATLTTGRTIGMTGDVVWTSPSFNGSGNVTATSTIQNSVVTYAKMQNISAQYRILGRITAAAGVAEELTPDNIVTTLGQATVNTFRQGTGSVVLATSPTLTTPVIDSVVASGTTATTTIHSAVTTGSIAIGAGLTTGTLNLAAVGTGATNINIGHTNSIVSIIGATTFTGSATAPSPSASSHVATKFYVDSVTLASSASTAYQISLTDIGKVIEMTASASNTVIIPSNATTAFPVGATIDIVQLGTGQTEISGPVGAIRSSGGKLKLSGQYSGVTLYNRGADDWVLIGDLTS